MIPKFLISLLISLFILSSEAVDCNPPCQQGFCIVGNACVCNQGYTGYRCEQPLCTGLPKQCGPGKCVAPNTCSCAGTNWTGSDCSIPICDPPCKNGAICNAPGSCLCAGTGYSGQYCETPLCNEPIGCGPGVCIGRNLCNCNGTGYNGTYCTDPICDPPCIHGYCRGPNGCDCTGTGYIGALCEMPLCDPPCLNNGICTADRTCDCRHLVGWNGSYCDKAICTTPCRNNGTCSAPDQCDCTGTGFAGALCEVDIDECSAAIPPCDVRSVCQNTIGGFNCVCPNGYTGGRKALGGCVDIDECALGRCDPLVQCTNTPGSYSCGNCPEGYSGTGEKCIPSCTPPCVNGNCTSLNVCTCTEGWRGALCNDQCPPSGCVVTSGSTESDTGFPFAKNGSGVIYFSQLLLPILTALLFYF